MTSQTINILSRHARQLNKAAQRSGTALDLPPVLFLTDQTRISNPASVIASLPSGSGVILRDYNAPDRGDIAQSVASACRQGGHTLLVGLDEALARDIGADGMHFPENALALARSVRQRHPDWWLTAAAHSHLAIRRAHMADADAVLVSSVFPTDSHPGARTLGQTRFAGLVRQAPLPVYALGGIDAKNARQLNGTGAIGIAAISGLT